MGLDPISGRQDYVFPDGTYDVREWEVRTLIDDAHAGAVHDLLLDGDGICRYLDVDLGLFDKHILLPVGHARADPARRLVWIPGLAMDQLEALTAYAHEPGSLTREDEQGVLAGYTSALARESHAPRPAWAGAVYGPSELEDHVSVASRLATLSERPDLDVAQGEPDPRGWTVLQADGERVGVVEELIVDMEAMKVRHLVCALEDEPGGGEMEPRRLLVPVGFAHLEPRRHAVRVAGLSARSLPRLPAYGGEALEEGLERALVERFRAEMDEGAFYDQARFDPHELFGPPADRAPGEAGDA